MAGSKTLRQVVNERMIGEGRWEEFCELRILMRSDDLGDDVSVPVATHFLPPKDGSSPEFELTEEITFYLQRYRAKIEERRQQGKEEVEVVEIVKPPPPDKFVTDFKVGKKDWTKDWKRLGATVPPARVANEADIVRWVFNNAGTNPNAILADDVPSLGALKYLQHVQTTKLGYADFLRNAWIKMLPDKKAIEYESRFQDDGRQQTKLLDEVLHSLGADMEVEDD